MTKEQFGKAIRDHRIKAGLSQVDAAKKCGVKRQYMHLLETGGVCPSITKADEILKALRASLLIGDGKRARIRKNA